MSDIGFVLPDEFSHFSLGQTLQFAELADEAGFHSVWKQEASGSNGFLTLGAISQRTTDIKLGIGVASIFSRTPALLGMSAVTLDCVSEGRAMLGLGVSSRSLVETWHGMEFDQPLRRMRESIEIITQIIAQDTVEYDGEIFNVGPYSTALSPVDDVPVFNAAIGSTNRQLTGEYADGWIPGFTPLSVFEGNLSEVCSSADRAGRNPDDLFIAPWVPTAVHENPDRAEYLARYILAQEMAMGYNEQVNGYGFGSSPDEAHDRFLEGDREGAAEAISQKMLDELSVYGTKSGVHQQIDAWHEAGADVFIAMPSMAASFDEIKYLLRVLGV